MSGLVQIGPRIDDDTWERFKDYVESKHGRTRGVTAKEVERALEAQMSAEYPTDRLARIENDVATIKANLAEPDGGQTATIDPTPTPSDACTHTPNGNKSEVDESGSKPHPKATKAEKVEWLWDHKVPQTPIVAPPEAFRSWIEDAFDFGDRATSNLLHRLFDRYHAKAVKRDPDDRWDVVVASTPAEREQKIDDYGSDGGEVYVLENDSGHVTGADVVDALLR